MASLHKETTKTNATTWRIRFTLDGQRKGIRLGDVPKKLAETVCSRVEELINCRLANVSCSQETARWLGGIENELHDKLAKVGLVEARKTATLEQYIPVYIAQLDNSKDTKANKTQTAKTLFAFFGDDRNPATITEQEAKNFRSFLLSHRMDRKSRMVKSDSVKPSIVWKRLQHVNEFFKAMLEDHLIEVNPFKNVKQSPNYGKDRKVYIPAEDIYQVMEYAPDAEWRLIIALWRFGGLRRSSEVLRLKWEHILWDQGKIIVPSCKTAIHEGKEQRIIPIFEELEAPLRDCFEQAEPGAVYLVEKHCPAKMKRSKNRADGNRESNLMTMFDKIVLRAGLNPWPMPGNNLRGSLVTDLYNGKYPEIGIHTIAAWIGHSPEIAMKHYTRIRDEDFDKVRPKAGHSAKGNAVSREVTRADDCFLAGQNAGQNTPEIGCRNLQRESETLQKQPLASYCKGLQSGKYPLGDSNPCYRTENPVS